MEKAEFMQIMNKLKVAYNKNYTADEYKMWFEEFKNSNLEDFKYAVDKTIKELSFVPKISDIRARMKHNEADYYLNNEYAKLYKNLEWCKIVKE